MDNIGYSKSLYILPFDHRATFAIKIFDLKTTDELSGEQRHLIREFKMLVYKGFRDALEKGVPKDKGAILCDEEFGGEVLMDAFYNKFVTILNVEKSEETEFKFQYENFQAHIEKYHPTFAKVLIRYNPKDDEDLKQRQKTKLKQVSDFCHDKKYKFLTEVLVIPTEEQLSTVSQNREEYDRKLRPALTVEVIKDLQSFGIEPDVWKLEGFEREEDYQEVVEAIKRDGRKNVGLVVLGRGENEEKVDEWLEVGAKVKGVIGFAVGRTVFWDSIEKFYKGEIGKAEVIETVSNNYLKFYKLFTNL